MDYEEMKIIWDTQNNEPLFAINRAELHANVLRKHRKFTRRMFWRDAREISIGILAAAGFLLFSWTLFDWDTQKWQAVLGPEVQVSRWHPVLMLIASAFFLQYALYHYLGRKRQERREQFFEASLLGDVQRTLAQTDYQIRMAQGVVRWGLVPIGIGTGLAISVMATLVPTPASVWPLIVFVLVTAFILDARCKRRPLKTTLLPMKQEFETLRRKLMDADVANGRH